MREDSSGTREFFEQILHKYKISVQLAYKASSTDIIRRSILGDDCLSLLSIHTFEEDIINGKTNTLKYILKKYKTSDFIKNLLTEK